MATAATQRKSSAHAGHAHLSDLGWNPSGHRSRPSSPRLRRTFVVISTTWSDRYRRLSRIRSLDRLDASYGRFSAFHLNKMNVIVASAQNSPRGSEDFDSQAALFGHGLHGFSHAVPVPVVAYDSCLREQVQRRYQICCDTTARMIGIQVNQIGA